MYDPRIGRWVSEDPIGFQAADANLYRYVRNSPTNLVDPSGNVSITSIDVATSGDGLGLVKKLGPKLGKQFGFGFKVTVTGVTCGDDITDAKVHQFIFNYTLYKGPKKALFRLKKDGIDGKEYNDPFGKEEKGVLEDANKDWESLVGSFKSSAWDNELGHDKNITGSYVAGVNDPKKKDQNIQKKGNNMIIWVDCPGHCATDSAPTEGFTTAEQRIAVLIAAQGTEDKKPVKRKFWIHHKAKLVKDQWVPDGRPEIKIDPLEK